MHRTENYYQNEIKECALFKRRDRKVMVICEDNILGIKVFTILKNEKYGLVANVQLCQNWNLDLDRCNYQSIKPSCLAFITALSASL